MAEVSVNIKKVMMASAVESNADNEKDARVAKALKAKVMRMKEDVTKEATRRAASMHDKGEQESLASALKLIASGDPEAAAAVLEERARLLQRRGDTTAKSAAEGRRNKQLAGAGDGHGGEATEVWQGLMATIDSGESIAVERWLAVVDGQLHIEHVAEPAGASGGTSGGGGGGKDPVPAASEGEGAAVSGEPLVPSVADSRGQLESSGFMLSEPVEQAAALSPQILQGMEALRKAGVPTYFIWVYDESWQLLWSMWRHAEHILGGECLLEPSFAAYHLDHATARSAQNEYVGNNFALPHRDYTFADSYDSTGNPTVLTVWVPVCDVDVDNGCMCVPAAHHRRPPPPPPQCTVVLPPPVGPWACHGACRYVVPREFDPNYERDDVYQHMMVQSTGWQEGKSYLSFPVAGVRPLAPARAGAMLAWHGNVVHWGGQCHQSAASRPRASLAWVFRRADVIHGSAAAKKAGQPLRYEQTRQLSLREREDMVLSSLDHFRHWTGDWDQNLNHSTAT